MGVDQSVLLLKKGNDIEQSTVFTELDKYGKVDKYNHQWYPSNGRSNQNFEDFSRSNMVLITNAQKKQSKIYTVAVKKVFHKTNLMNLF